ncbi:MAG TPA: hypothetical protein VHL78_09050 [Actinomycetota bacterium]|nr:hypothetical protein [Actinomycetota bacterium]
MAAARAVTIAERTFDVKRPVESPRGGATSQRGARTRLRCRQCGNLTRFDVVEWRRTRAYYHYSLGGDLTVEEERILDGARERITCRWCGSSGDVEEIPLEGP